MIFQRYQPLITDEFVPSISYFRLPHLPRRLPPPPRHLPPPPRPHRLTLVLPTLAIVSVGISHMHSLEEKALYLVPRSLFFKIPQDH